MVDIRTDKDYKLLYEQAHIDRMKYADELTTLEEQVEQLKFDLLNGENKTKEQIEDLLKKVGLYNEEN